MGYNLFLDDERMPEKVANFNSSLSHIYKERDWEIVRDYDQFVRKIETDGLPDMVSFDHDLAEIHYNPSTWSQSFSYKEKTGYDCAKWMINYVIENGLPLPETLVHSLNPVGRENIENLITNYKNFFK